MKIKFAIEFETEVPFDENTDMMYYQDEIEDIVYACALDATANSKVTPTGEWRYIAENDGKEEYIQGVFDEYETPDDVYFDEHNEAWAEQEVEEDLGYKE